MESVESLREGEDIALTHSQYVTDQHISNVHGKKTTIKGRGRLKTFSATGLITVIIGVFLLLVLGPVQMIPAAVVEGIVEETDVQYTDAVQSKMLVFQQAMREGEIPSDTAKILKENGVLVGYVGGDSGFVETTTNGGGLALLLTKDGNVVVTANDFVNMVNTNVNLYNAINNATYSRAAYYYDEEAREVFREIGTNRDNYTGNESFGEVMSKLVGEGSNVNINSVSLVEKTRKNEETGETEVYYEYEENGAAANSGAADFIAAVVEKNPAETMTESTLDVADTLKVADTISKEQRSSLFFLTFAENVSKMMAGEGNTSKINEAMNYLYTKEESNIVDVKTGNVMTNYGAPLDSPSLYAVLTKNKVNAAVVDNYSSDRILKTAENQLGLNGSGSTIDGTVASSTTDVRGSIGRLVLDSTETASDYIIGLITPTVESSMMENSFETIKGINAGEFMVEGAINVGKKLAKRSGATAGDAAAVINYAKLTSSVLAMDAAADRANRSPFDASSKNTFLGSIVYNFAIGLNKAGGGSILSQIGSVFSTVGQAFASILPATRADEAEGYLTTFGDCETYGTIGAVGSAQCAEIAVFDTSTLNDTFNDPGFIAFVEANTILDASGKRVIKDDSYLARFILYNDERITPLGVMDGGILDSLRGDSNKIAFISDILEMIEMFLDTPEEEKRIGSGEAFVNSSSNPDWENYKYAQRYVSLARAAATLRQYSNDSTAYNNIRYFEGNENPVVAFLDRYYAIANQ